MTPPNESNHKNGFIKAILNILLIVPLVVAGYFFGLAKINANKGATTDDFIYDYRGKYTPIMSNIEKNGARIPFYCSK
jgi:hypothetical protein